MNDSSRQTMASLSGFVEDAEQKVDEHDLDASQIEHLPGDEACLFQVEVDDAEMSSKVP